MTQAGDKQWHYESGGRCTGPLDRTELVGLIHQGIIRPDTLVCFEEGEWVAAAKSDLSVLFSKRRKTIGVLSIASPFVVILALNIIVFAVMVASGAGLLEPKLSVLLDWGANFGPKTMNGEWWRILTSTFIHIGFLHLVFNMFALIQIGWIMQGLMGRGAFTIAYVVSGLVGSLASLIWNPYVVSAGASGAIFGLYGAMLGFSMVQRGKVPKDAMSGLVGFAVLFIGYNVVYGLIRPGTDMAAHAGGLIGGFVCSLGLCAGTPSESRKGRIVRNVAVSVVAAVVIVAAAKNIPHPIDLQAELKHFADIESGAVTKYNAALVGFRTGKMKVTDFANLLERDILPDWIAELDSLGRLRGLPQKQGDIVAILIKYMQLRREAWAEFAEGTRENKLDKLQDAAKKQREAELVLKDIGKLGKS